MKRRAGVSAVVAAVFFTLTPAPEPMIQCEDNRHVWRVEQCDRSRGPTSFPGGGGAGGCGITCQVGRILGGLTGGLL